MSQLVRSTYIFFSKVEIRVLWCFVRRFNYIKNNNNNNNGTYILCTIKLKIVNDIIVVNQRVYTRIISL